MDIIGMEDRKDRDKVVVRAVMSTEEFGRLQGRLDNLVVFSPETINIPTSTIKTGARHSYARYLLLPVKVRRKLRGDSASLEGIKCGVITGTLERYVLYIL